MQLGPVNEMFKENSPEGRRNIIPVAMKGRGRSNISSGSFQADIASYNAACSSSPQAVIDKIVI